METRVIRNTTYIRALYCCPVLMWTLRTTLLLLLILLLLKLLKVRQFVEQHVCSTVVSLHFLSGIGDVNTAQIEDMASKPEYALVRPSADDLAPLSAEVIQDTCAG